MSVVGKKALRTCTHPLVVKANPSNCCAKNSTMSVRSASPWTRMSSPSASYEDKKRLQQVEIRSPEDNHTTNNTSDDDNNSSSNNSNSKQQQQQTTATANNSGNSNRNSVDTRLDADRVGNLLVDGTLVFLGGESTAVELAPELSHGGSLCVESVTKKSEKTHRYQSHQSWRPMQSRGDK